MSVKIELEKLWQQYEAEIGRRVIIDEVSAATGISRPTLIRLRKDKVKRPDLVVISKLCEFFNVPPGPVPFVVWERD